MNSIEVARKVVEEKTAYMFRQLPNGSYETKLWGSGKKKGWIILDLFSASAFVKVYDALNDENKEKLRGVHLTKAVAISFKLIK